MSYHYRANRCQCHPETCCCMRYEVIEPNGNVYIQVDDAAKAAKIAKALTHLENYTSKRSAFNDQR